MMMDKDDTVTERPVTLLDKRIKRFQIKFIFFSTMIIFYSVSYGNDSVSLFFIRARISLFFLFFLEKKEKWNTCKNTFDDKCHSFKHTHHKTRHAHQNTQKSKQTSYKFQQLMSLIIIILIIIIFYKDSRWRMVKIEKLLKVNWKEMDWNRGNKQTQTH